MKKNLVKINSAFTATEIAPKKYTWSISNYLSYFYAHKIIICISAIISFSLAFTFFFNKQYNTKISYIVNTNQSFQSNILASSLLGKGDNSVFSNLVERSYNHSKSRRFNKQLASVVLKNRKNSYIFQYIKNELDFDQSFYEMQNEYLLELTDFFEDKINVKLKDENQIVFSITTKDSRLTESIQQLINSRAKEILTKEPLKEVTSASLILKNQLKETQRKLNSLDIKKIEIQNKVRSINPRNLALKLSSLEVEMEKKIFNQKSSLSSINSKLKQLEQEFRRNPYDYSLRDETLKTRKEKLEIASKLSSLDKSLKKLKTKSKHIPKTLSNIQKIEREQEILLKTTLKFTEKESLAAISIQKIKDSISLLSAEENINSSNDKVLIIKAIAITVFMLILVLTSIYYKQAFFPSIMTREEFEKTLIPVSTAFSPFKWRQRDNGMLITINNVSRDRITEEIKGLKTISFMNSGSTYDSEKSLNSIIKKLVMQGQKVYVLNFNITARQRRFFRSLAKKNPTAFIFKNINESMNNKSILNVDKIQEELNSKEEYDHFVLNITNIESMANKALIANISDKTYAFATLNKTKYAQMNNLVKLYNILSTRSQIDLNLILTRSKSGDNISSFLNKKIKDNGQHNENQSKAV